MACFTSVRGNNGDDTTRVPDACDAAVEDRNPRPYGGTVAVNPVVSTVSAQINSSSISSTPREIAVASATGIDSADADTLAVK
jgi:hypothetical protein